MSKATKLRKQAQNRKSNQKLNNLIKEKLTQTNQPIKSIQETTLSNGQKGARITFDIFS